jgi:transposase
MKWVHGTKAKNDRIDSEKIARNTIGGYLPKAYPYPRELRATRDLLRRRSRFVSMRTGVMTHIKTLNAQVNLPPLGRVNRTPDKRVTIPSRFSDPDVAMSAEMDATTADYFDSAIHQVERHVLRRTKEYRSKDLALLMTVPGIGKILGLTIALEIHNIDRFDTRQDFCAYSRLIRSPHTSNDKKVGWAGRKIGNPYLKWAFSETVFHAIHSRPEINAYWQKMLKKREPGAAQAVLAHKFGRAIYYMLKRGTVFDEEQFLKGR